MKILYATHNVFLSSTLKNNLVVPKNFKKLPFDKIKNLNKIYRQKEVATDILSFPLSKENGEIFINPQVAKIKAKKFEFTYENYLLFLVIHGLFHLKGMKHGSL